MLKFTKLIFIVFSRTAPNVKAFFLSAWSSRVKNGKTFVDFFKLDDYHCKSAVTRTSKNLPLQNQCSLAEQIIASQSRKGMLIKKVRCTFFSVFNLS